MSSLLWLSALLVAWQSANPPALLDFEVYKRDVQPVFLQKRPGLARCASCHSQGTPFRLEPLEAGATWSEEASRKNFETVQRYVVSGKPDASRLLLLPLASEAGGNPFHPGGKHWTSQSDPEWQRIARWIRGAPAP